MTDPQEQPNQPTIVDLYEKLKEAVLDSPLPDKQAIANHIDKIVETNQQNREGHRQQ